MEVLNLERMMVFIDGENLVFRFQDMLEKKYIPRNDVLHEPEIYMWHPRIIRVGGLEIIRVTYYTSAVGDEVKISTVSQKIKGIKYEFNDSQRIPRTGFLLPKVFKKDKQTVKTKGVDINIAVDMLTHTFKNSVDSVYLVTGDGDYLPLIEEVMRNGKKVYLAALSSGLNPSLKTSVDTFFDLDHHSFKNCG